MLKYVGALFDRVCAVACAILFAQFPLFIHQYQGQLIGREAELRLQVDAMRHAASISGKNLEQFINKFVASADADFSRQGVLMQGIVDRWQTIHEALSALQASSIYTRPIKFLAHLNADAFKSTFENYTFGMTLTIEGGIYALFGVAVGYLLFSGFRRMFKRPAKAPAT